MSFRCRHWRFGFVSGQVSLAWSIALHTHELYTQLRVLKKRWREERTSSRFLNFFQAVFTCIVVHNHLLLRACLLGSKRKLPPQACRTSFCGLPLKGHAVPRQVFCQALEPAAFLVHPVLAAIAEEAVAAQSSAADGTWKLA